MMQSLSKLLSKVKGTLTTGMIAMTVISAALLVTNVLSVTNAGFHQSLHGLMSAVLPEAMLNNSPMRQQRLLQAETQQMRREKEALATKARAQQARLGEARTVAKRVTERTARNVTINVASVAGEAVPYLGVALVVSVTAADVKDGCDTVKDVNEMLRMFDADPIDEDQNEVCGMTVPSIEEVQQKIVGTMDSAGQRLMEGARKYWDRLARPGTDLYDLLHPN